MRMGLKAKSINNPLDRVTIGDVDYTKLSLARPNWSFNKTYDGAANRFEVRAGDRGLDTDAAINRERSELQTADLDAGTSIYGFNANVWLAFSLKIEPGLPLLTAATVGQFRAPLDSADTVAPDSPLSFVLGTTAAALDNVPLTIQTRFDATAASSTVTNPTPRFTKNLVRGNWYNFVIRVKFSVAGAAELDIWCNGTKEAALTGISIGYNHSTTDSAAYWQYGIARTGNANPLVVVFANMEQGRSSLLARVAGPRPAPPFVQPPFGYTWLTHKGEHVSWKGELIAIPA